MTDKERITELERLVDYILVELVNNPATTNGNLCNQLRKFREETNFENMFENVPTNIKQDAHSDKPRFNKPRYCKRCGAVLHGIPTEVALTVGYGSNTSFCCNHGGGRSIEVCGKCGEEIYYAMFPREKHEQGN